jgi:CheY-like chemotaxis protein
MAGVVALSVGRDPVLLKTRTLVLERSRYKVVARASVGEALDCLQANEFDLILLCHSLSNRERERLTNSVRSRGLNARVVLVTTNAVLDDHRSVDAVIESRPERMLEQLQALLSGKPTTSTGKLCKWQSA